MSNDEDFVLTLMKAKKHDPVVYPETFHVGFYVDDAATVRAKRDELTAAGLSPGEIHDAGRHGRGTHFYCTAPGNVVVEIATAATSHRGRLNVGEFDGQGSTVFGGSANDMRNK
jgi:hypothetical protein